MEHHSRRTRFSPGTFGTILLVATVFCLVATPLLADEYTAALKRAKAEDKPVVLYFYSRYCHYCTAMEKEVLADREIARTMSRSLVSLRIDADKRMDLATRYGVWGYPTTCLLEPSGKAVVKIPGYIGKKQYKIFLDYATGKHYKSTGLRKYMKNAGMDAG